jgi:integration host factor subunit alpha
LAAYKARIERIVLLIAVLSASARIRSRFEAQTMSTSSRETPGNPVLPAADPGAVTRADLAEAVRVRAGLKKSASSLIVDCFIDEICAALAGGEDVKLTGFGAFIRRSKNARLARNPKTGEAAVVTARNVVVFHPSPVLKAKINA